MDIITAKEIAARIWCDEEMQSVRFDAELATEIAVLLCCRVEQPEERKNMSEKYQFDSSVFCTQCSTLGAYIRPTDFICNTCLKEERQRKFKKILCMARPNNEKEMKLERFWMVLREGNGSFSQKRHLTADSARVEAKRLCKKEGVRFYVLKVTAYAEPKEPSIIRIK